MLKGADFPKDRALDSQLALSLIGKDAPHDLILSRDFVTRIGNLCDVAFLRKLNVSFNQIRSLDGIDQLPQLKQLLAYACDIDKIECLKLLSKIEVVMLQQNKIYKMNDTFSGLTKLQELRLDQNKISKIEFLSGCVSLRKLDLSFNNIDSLTGLSGLQQLQELKISNNSIKTLAPLKALPSIKDLDVSNNQLKSIDGLQQMPTLEYVKADHNMISELRMSAMMGSNKRAVADSSKDKKQPVGGTKKPQAGAVAELADTVGPMLVEITLSGNRIRSVEGLELFKATLESVDLSSNNLSPSELSSMVATFKQCTKLSELRMYMNPITAEEDTVRALAEQLTQACPALRALDGLSIVASTDPLAAKSSSQTAFHTWNDDASTVLDGRSLAGETLHDEATQQDEEASEHDSDVDSEEEREKAKEDNTEVKRYPPNLMLQEMLTPEEIQAKEAEIRNGLKYCKDKLENATRSVFGFADETAVEQPAFKARRLLSTTPSASGLRVAAALDEADAISKSSKFNAESATAKESSVDTVVAKKTDARPISTGLKEKEKLVDRVRLAVSNSVKDFTSPLKEEALPSAAPTFARLLTSDSAPRVANTNASLLTDDVRASFNAQELSEFKAESKNSPQRPSPQQQADGSPNARAESKSVTSSSSGTVRTKPSVAASFLLGVGPAPLGSGTTRYGTKVKAPASKSRVTGAAPVKHEASTLQSALSVRSDVETLNILNLKITKPSQNVYMTEWENDAPAVTASTTSTDKAEDKQDKEDKQEYAAPVGSLESITSPFREYQEYATSDEEDADEGHNPEGAYFAENNSRQGYEDHDYGAKEYETDEMDIPAGESELDAEVDGPSAMAVEEPEPVYREVRLRPDDRFGKAIASHGGGGGFDVRGLRRGSEPLTPHGGATDDLRAALQSRDRDISSAGAGSSSGGGGAVLRRGFSEPKMDGPEALGQLDTRDYKLDMSETPPLSPASASVVSLPSYRPMLLAPSAATATLLATSTTNSSLSPRPIAGPAVSTTSQPKMRFKIPQSARNAINNPQSKDTHDSPAPSHSSGGNLEISALEQEVLRASRAAVAKQSQHNPVTPLAGAPPGPFSPFSPRPDHK